MALQTDVGGIDVQNCVKGFAILFTGYLTTLLINKLGRIIDGGWDDNKTGVRTRSILVC